MTPSLGDTLPQSNSAPSPSESSKPEIPSSEPVHSENDVKSAAPTVLSPETVNKQALQPEKTHSNQTKNQGPTTEVAKQPVPTRKGFVHTITAADGTKAQVYLSKSGGHAGIVFRDQIFRGKLHIVGTLAAFIQSADSTSGRKANFTASCYTALCSPSPCDWMIF